MGEVTVALAEEQFLYPPVSRSAKRRGMQDVRTFSPGLNHQPGLKGLAPGERLPLWSRFLPRTGTNGCGPGARHIGPGSCLEPGPKVPDEPGPMPHVARPAVWPHEPGLLHPLVPVRD